MIIDIAQPNLTIQTRQGREIQYQRGLRADAFSLNARTRYQQDRFSDRRLIHVRKESTGMYNCHGMTFVARRGILEDDEAIQAILADDEYYPVEPGNVRPGDIVLYYHPTGNLEHSGIVVNVPTDEGIFNPIVLSKWGVGGEYIHRCLYCPYPLTHIEFLREGRND